MMTDPAIPPPAIETLIQELRRDAKMYRTLNEASCDAAMYERAADALTASATSLREMEQERDEARQLAATREQALREECDKWKADFHAAHTMYDDMTQREQALGTALEAARDVLVQQLQEAQTHSITDEQDGAIGLDWDYGARDVVALTLTKGSLGYSALFGDRSYAGRVYFDEPLPLAVLEWFKAKALATILAISENAAR